MTHADDMVSKLTDVAAGCVAFAMASLVAAPFILILAAPFVAGW